MERTFRSVIDALILTQFRSHAPRMPHVEFLFRRRFVECYGVDVRGEGEDVGDGNGVEGEILVGEKGGHCSVFSCLEYRFWRCVEGFGEAARSAEKLVGSFSMMSISWVSKCATNHTDGVAN